MASSYLKNNRENGEYNLSEAKTLAIVDAYLSLFMPNQIL
jgi:hypothetical protein